MWEIWENKLLPEALKFAQSPINRQIWLHWPGLVQCFSSGLLRVRIIYKVDFSSSRSAVL